MKKTKTNGHRSAPVMEDDLDAVKSIAAILGQFSAEDRSRILRWTREKFGLDEPQVAEVPGSIILPENFTKAEKHMRNPHESNKPPLNKVMVQDDDDEGALLGIPMDRDVPEPPEAAILKPNVETRKLVTVVDRHKGKDGKIVESRSLVMR